jgi:hypothetical protein
MKKAIKVNRSRAQSLLEYVVVIACIAAGVFAMQIYIKRGVEGRLKAGSDSISEEHYASDNIDSDVTTKFNVHTKITQKRVTVKDKSGVELKDPKSGLPMSGLETSVDSEEIVVRSGIENVGGQKKQ